MSRRLDVLMGALGGASQAGGSAYLGKMGRDITELEAPYKRKEWEQAVEQRKQNILNAEMQRRSTEASMNRMQAMEDRELRKEDLAEQQREKDRQKKMAQHDAWMDFVPRVLGPEGGDPETFLASLSNDAIDALIGEAMQNPDLTGHDNWPPLEKYLYNLKKQREMEAERNFRAREGAADRYTRRAVAHGRGKPEDKVETPEDLLRDFFILEEQINSLTDANAESNMFLEKHGTKVTDKEGNVSYDVPLAKAEEYKRRQRSIESNYSLLEKLKNTQAEKAAKYKYLTGDQESLQRVKHEASNVGRNYVELPQGRTENYGKGHRTGEPDSNPSKLRWENRGY